MDVATVTPGAHKHGYYYTLSDMEQGILLSNGYRLNTNLFYKRGGFYEIPDPKGAVVNPIELGVILQRLSA